MNVTTKPTTLLIVALTLLACGPEKRYVRGPMPAQGTFSGDWRADMKRAHLEQTGNHVTGTWNDMVNDSTGSIDGVVEGNVLAFKWHDSQGYVGDGELQLGADGNSFTGLYRTDVMSVDFPWDSQRDAYPTARAQCLSGNLEACVHAQQLAAADPHTPPTDHPALASARCQAGDVDYCLAHGLPLPGMGNELLPECAPESSCLVAALQALERARAAKDVHAEQVAVASLHHECVSPGVVDPTEEQKRQMADLDARARRINPNQPPRTEEERMERVRLKDEVQRALQDKESSRDRSRPSTACEKLWAYFGDFAPISAATANPSLALAYARRGCEIGGSCIPLVGALTMNQATASEAAAAAQKGCQNATDFARRHPAPATEQSKDALCEFAKTVSANPGKPVTVPAGFKP